MVSLEPSSTSFTWNFIRCACILTLLFVPAAVLGVILYGVFYSADLALFCMTVFCSIILSIIGGLWFAYFDLKYARLYELYKLKR